MRTIPNGGARDIPTAQARIEQPKLIFAPSRRAYDMVRLIFSDREKRDGKAYSVSLKAAAGRKRIGPRPVLGGADRPAWSEMVQGQPDRGHATKGGDAPGTKCLDDNRWGRANFRGGADIDGAALGHVLCAMCKMRHGEGVAGVGHAATPGIKSPGMRTPFFLAIFIRYGRHFHGTSLRAHL